MTSPVDPPEPVQWRGHIDPADAWDRAYEQHRDQQIEATR